MAISASDVKNLREKTGAGMMDCKKALTECNGDFETAVDFLRTKGLAAAQKKQSRIAAEGSISAYIDGKVGALVEINCETDFVAKNSDFQNFVNSTAKYIADKEGQVTAEDTKIKDEITNLTLKLGEKLSFRRCSYMKLDGAGLVSSYVHNGKIGVLVEISAENDSVASKTEVADFAKDVCMHVAATDPKFLSSSDMDENFKNREAEIYAAQLREQGKPENMIPNIIKGKMNKLASEVCLNDQKFVKDPDKSIAQLAKEVSKTAGGSVEVKQFIKLNMGEGIEKKEDNLADEVAKMTKK